MDVIHLYVSWQLNKDCNLISSLLSTCNIDTKKLCFLWNRIGPTTLKLLPHPSFNSIKTAKRGQRFVQGDFQHLTGFLSSKRWRCFRVECQHQGQMEALVSTCHPLPTSATPVTPHPAICADLPLAVASSSGGWAVPACVRQLTTQLCRCYQGKKYGDGGESKANI